MKKWWTISFGVLGFLASSSFTGAASAEYVCYAVYSAANGSRGAEGYLAVNLYTGPDCTGSFESSRILCSPGATSTSCASSATYHYDRSVLMTYLNALSRAAAVGQPIEYSLVSCNGGGSGCQGYLYFYGNI